MKNILKLLVFCTFFSSCKDPMELKSPINKHLDSEIAERMSRFTALKEYGLTPTAGDHLRPEEIDKEIKGMVNSVNLFDASTAVQERADKYFSKYTDSQLLNKGEFIEIKSLDSKPEVILALKLNELTLLDHLLFITYNK